MFNFQKSRMSRRVKFSSHVFGDTFFVQNIIYFSFYRCQYFVFRCSHLIECSRIRHELTYASQSWRGFASRAALDRLDSFLRRSVKAGFYPPQSPMFEELCEALDKCPFKALMCNPVHPLHHLLPSKIMRLRDTRNRSHPYQLPSKGDSLHDKTL